MSRPTWDDLKLARDGQLSFGVPVRRPQPKPGSMLWAIERDEDGMPTRMIWCGRVPEQQIGAA